jgi:dienelactone hydrolase
MAELLLFHHAQGMTPGVRAFADELRGAGHTVHAPDLYDGRTFEDLAEGVAHGRGLGTEALLDRARREAAELPDRLVYAGWSLGVLPAQLLAQTRPGAAGAVFLEACAPAAEFGAWPAGLPVEVHGMDADPWFAAEGDLDAAREVVEASGRGQLFLYPGDRHLFADASLPAYDAEAATLLRTRLLAFLDSL